MWKLNQPNAALKQWYQESMLKGLHDRILTKQDRDGNELLTDNVRRILIKSKGKDNLSRLKYLLTIEPVALKRINDALMRAIFNALGKGAYDDAEFEDFLKAKAKKERGRNAAEKALYDKYADILDKLRQVFDYDCQLGGNKSRAYRLTSEQGHNTCTYCNRQYIFTIVHEEGGTDKDRIARPVLDHWYSKELFPLMSLSLYNLIPSCSICNSSAKGNTIFRLGTHIHPYEATNYDEPSFKFRYKAQLDGRWTVAITPSKDAREQAMINIFKLEDIYSYHGELEVKDILDWQYQNNDTYLCSLLNDMLAHYKINMSDVYHMVLGTELDPKHNLNRPLSKLKRDILKQVGILDSNGKLKQKI